MKTLEQFAVGRDLTVIIKIGEISAAFSTMQFLRQKFRAAEAEIAQQRQSENVFNFVHELGESYGMFVAKQQHAAALIAQRRAEKYFKKLCHQFVELGADQAQVTELKQILTVHHA